MRDRLLAVVLVVPLLLLAACGGGSAGDPRAAVDQMRGAQQGGQQQGPAGNLSGQLTGAGATFPEPLYLDWIGEYRKRQPNVSINYQGIGSSGGVQQFIARTVQFAGSDAFMKDDELKAATTAWTCEPLHIPTVFGAVVIPYNLPNVPNLVLDGETLARIFLGEITSFRDPAIARLNPGASLPDQRITVVHRSDGSGTTSIFTTYLDDVSPAWKQRVGKGKDVKWPVGLGGQGNDGVTAAVQQNAGTIGYVELSYALENKLPTARMINKSGTPVTPTLESTAAAAEGIQIPDDLRFNVLGVGGNGYPIVGATWILAAQCGYTQPQAAALKDFLTWALTQGDEVAKQAHYAPINDALQARALQKVNQINARG